MAETGVRIMNSETPTLEAREETMVRAGLRISVFCLAQLSVLVTKSITSRSARQHRNRRGHSRSFAQQRRRFEMYGRGAARDAYLRRVRPSPLSFIRYNKEPNGKVHNCPRELHSSVRE